MHGGRNKHTGSSELGTRPRHCCELDYLVEAKYCDNNTYSKTNEITFKSRLCPVMLKCRVFHCHLKEHTSNQIISDYTMYGIEGLM